MVSGGRAGCLAGAAMGLLAGCSPVQESEQPPVVTVSAPRDYGYVIGDIIEQTLDVELTGGQTLDAQSLPVPGAVNEWLAVRGSRWSVSRNGPREKLEIHVAYQVFKGVRAPEQAVIPPLTLRLAGSPLREFHTPAWPFTLAPVIPAGLKDELVELREPVPAEPLNAGPLLRQWLFWLASLAGVGALFGLRHYLNQRRVRPFAVACRQLKAALRHRQDADELRVAARLLHRALDQTFGATLFAGQLDRFCAEHPVFAPLRERLAAFFMLSQGLFFAIEGPENTDNATRDWLIDLSQRCAAAERKAL